MKDSVKVLFITQEIFPYVAETAMSKLCREYPQYIQEQGCEIRTFMPCFGNINERRNQLHEVQRLSGMNLIIDDADHPLIIKVASIQSARMQVYFIDNEDFFSRKGMVGSDDGVEYDDNGDRVIFYVRGVLETIKKLRWTPDIIHCHGFMSALAPLYIKTAYHDDPFFHHSKVIYSIYDDVFEKKFPKGFDERLLISGVSPEHVKDMAGKQVDYEALTRLAIDFSDAVIAGSENISKSLITYTQQKGLSYLPYSDDYKTDYADFYGTVYPPFNENI